MRRASLLTIFLIVFIDLMGFGIVLPNLQLYGHDFGITNYFILVLFGATYSFFQFLFTPVLGRWSDHIGRRPVLLLSQVGTLVGFLVLFAAHYFANVHSIGLGIALIFISRVIDGISGGNISTASAYIADITPPEKRAKGLGLIGAAFGLGFVFGPLLGGFTAYYLGLAYVPLVAAAFSVAAIVMTWTQLAESLDPQHKPEGLRRFSFDGLVHSLRRPIIGSLILMFFVNGFAFAGMEQTLSLLIQYRIFPTPTTMPATATATTEALTAHGAATHSDLLHIQDKRASFASGILFFGLGIVIALIQGGMIHRLTKRFGEPALVIGGPLIIAAGLLIIGIPVGWAWPWTGFVVGCFLLAVGSSIFNPSLQSLISRHARASEQGEVLGANQGMASLARALGPILAGVLFEYVSPGSTYYTSAALTVVVAIAAVMMRDRLRAPATPVPADAAFPVVPTAEPEA